jgi:hypothetical protein
VTTVLRTALLTACRYYLLLETLGKLIGSGGFSFAACRTSKQ